ncbi:TIGR02611 family protein [Kineococcus sp. SYSU DK006]|uniref:TIGR02611 family protein n=1 Tax=Kineococcus sp. SYSU DK006 TaxID=3383127 RepID=UPI003D7DC6CD
MRDDQQERELPDPPPAPRRAGGEAVPGAAEEVAGGAADGAAAADAVAGALAFAPAADRPVERSAHLVHLRRRRAHRLRVALHERRERIRADTHKNRVYRAVVGAAGTAVVLLGLVLVPLPGPGWLVVFLGLAVLGSEFSSARRLNAFARRHVHRWGQWLAARSLAVRGALAGGTALVVTGAVWGYLAWQGVPAWTPEVVTAQLTRVPGL